MDAGTRAAEWTRPLSTSTCVWLPVLNRKIQHYTFWVQVSLSEWTKMTELRWLSRFVSSLLTHLFAEFSPTDRGQSLHDASVCLWRATGPNRILYSSVRNLDPDGIWFQTSSLKGHGVIWSLLLRISTVVQSCHSHSALTEQNVFFVFWPHSQWRWLKTQHWWKSKDSL